MKEEKTWRTYPPSEDYTCPACEEEALCFDKRIRATLVDAFGQVYVDWEVHCPKCGKQFKFRDIYKHTHSKTFEED